MKGVLAFATLLAIGVSCAARSAPLEAYGRLPTIEQAAISPDGALAAVTVTDGETRKVLIQQLSDHQITLAVNGGQQKLRDIEWAGSQHLLIIDGVTTTVPDLLGPKTEWTVFTDLDVETKKMRRFDTGIVDTMNVTEGPPAVRLVDGKPMIFVKGYQFVDDLGHLSLFETDPASGRTRLVRTGLEHAVDFLVDDKGALLAEADFDADKSAWALSVGDNGQWRVALAEQNSFGGPNVVGLGRDGRSVLLEDDDADLDQEGLHELAPDAKDWGPVFAVGEDEDFIFDPTTGALIGVHALIGEEDRYTFYDHKDQVDWDAAVRAYPGARVTLQSMSADHRRFIVLVDSPTDSPAYALVDINTGKADWLGPQYAGVTADDVAPRRPVAFKAKDGLELTGYLTLPKGKDPKGLPLIVFPHGGPAARDEPGFDWWDQAMASHGYAVLQVNYRGSSGFGWKFLSAGFGEWGRKMQTDLSDGVRDLAAQGVIDPKRVCVVGASYGGYAALAGATLDPGVYRCAASVAGISDVRKFVTWSKSQSDVSSQRYWDRFMGAKGPGDPVLRAISPIAHIDADTVPILLIHGKDDTTVPFEQSQMMADALHGAGKPVEFVVLNHEDHYLSHGDTRLQMLQAVMTFVEKYDPPG